MVLVLTTTVVCPILKLAPDLVGPKLDRLWTAGDGLRNSDHHIEDVDFRTCKRTFDQNTLYICK